MGRLAISLILVLSGCGLNEEVVERSVIETVVIDEVETEVQEVDYVDTVPLCLTNGIRAKIFDVGGYNLNYAKAESYNQYRFWYTTDASMYCSEGSVACHDFENMIVYVQISTNMYELCQVILHERYHTLLWFMYEIFDGDHSRDSLPNWVEDEAAWCYDICETCGFTGHEDNLPYEVNEDWWGE